MLFNSPTILKGRYCITIPHFTDKITEISSQVLPFIKGWSWVLNPGLSGSDALHEVAFSFLSSPPPFTVIKQVISETRLMIFELLTISNKSGRGPISIQHSLDKFFRSEQIICWLCVLHISLRCCVNGLGMSRQSWQVGSTQSPPVKLLERVKLI